MSLYDKRVQRSELAEKLTFLTISDRDAVLDALDEINERFEVSRINPTQGETDLDSLELLDYFLAAKQVCGCSQKTLDQYKSVLTRMLDQMDMPFTRMTTHDIMGYFTRMENDFQLAASTRASNRYVFNSFFSWLTAEEYVQKNPMDRVPPIKVPKEMRKPYSKIELAKLESAAYNPDDSRALAIIHFLRSTACRISEACQLNEADVDLNHRRAKVIGKGSKERFIHFDEEAEFYLRAYLAEREDDDPALFHGKRGRLTPGGVRLILREIAEDAGVDKTHPHRFRRTQATNLLRKGMPLEKVSKLLGHSKLDTTMTYIYLDDEDIAVDYKKFA